MNCLKIGYSIIRKTKIKFQKEMMQIAKKCHLIGLNKDHLKIR